jgi:hypothetical protein
MMTLHARIIAGLAFMAFAITAADGYTAEELVTGVWQHHEDSFDYVGLSSLYTCEGLESQSRQILLYLGARGDVTVRASGCGGVNVPSHNARLDADFYTLTPPSKTDGNSDVQAQWSDFHIDSERPHFMSKGDCELIHAMRDFILKNFSARAVEYRANCLPNSVNLDAYSIKGRVLKPVSLAVSSASP